MAYQVSVFLENKIGKLEEVTAVLNAENINIRTSSLNHTAGGWGILNFVTNDPGAAFKALQSQNIHVVLRRKRVLPRKSRGIRPKRARTAVCHGLRQD